MRIFAPSAWILFSAFILFASAISIQEGWQNTEANGRWDASTHIIRGEWAIKAQFKGSKSATVYQVAVPSNWATHVSSVSLSQDTQVLALANKEEPYTQGNNSAQIYSFTLKKEASSGSTVSLTLQVILTNVLVPFPPEISQGENQLVVLGISAYFYSPYPTTTQTQTVKLASSRVESFTEEPAKVARRGETVTYGPYKNTPAFSYSPVNIHYEYPKTSLTVRSLKREIEVSMWGNLAVEEHYELVNAGAKHAGSFNRADYQKTKPSHVISSFVIELPSTAVDAYYRDDIGNISSSQVIYTPKKVDLRLVPRFPLLGGWKTIFYTGYNLPLSSNLTRVDGKYVLNVALLPQIQDAVYDDVEIRIVLPEHAGDVKLSAPFAISNEQHSTFATYLDTAGRHVITFSVSNKVIDDNAFLQVSFTWSSTNLVREPLVVASSLFAFFLVVIVLFRLDFSIDASKANSNETQERIARAAPLIKQVTAAYSSMVEARESLASNLEKAVERNNFTNLDSQRRAAETTVASARVTLTKLAADLDSIDSVYSNRLRQLIDLERDLFDASVQFQTKEVAFHQKTLTTDNFKTARNAFVPQVVRLNTEIAALVAELVEDS